MAQIHNELRRGILTEALKKVVGDSRSDGGIERYGETLQPVVDLWDRPEFALLRNEYLWGITETVAGVAAEFSMWAVVNPLNSRQIVTVEFASIRISAVPNTALAALAPRSAIVATLGGTGSSIVGLDNRATGPDPSIAVRALNLESFEGTDPALIIVGTGNIDQVNAVDQENKEFKILPVILKPGTGYVIQCQVVNTAIAVQARGRVRVAQPTELFPVSSGG